MNCPTADFVFWLMGPTSSGKTTVAKALVDRLKQLAVPVIHYDGDEVRGFFGEMLGFSEKERLKVVRTIVYLSNKASGAGCIVVVSALTAYEDARSYIKENIPNLKIGYLQCSIKECKKRDPKGLYRQAELNQINTLVGVNSEYVVPHAPDIVLDSETYSVDQLVEKIITFLSSDGKNELDDTVC